MREPPRTRNRWSSPSDMSEPALPPLPDPGEGGGCSAGNHSSAGGTGCEQDELLALLTLEQVPGTGPVRIRELLREAAASGHGSPARTALELLRRKAGSSELDRAALRAADMLRDFKAMAHGEGVPPVHLLGIGLRRYPEALYDLHDAPPTLFARGELELLDRPCVAIVGTRRSTRYGERVASGIASVLARAGACIVSGLATGIDAEAHRAALACGGATAAVLGTGIDRTYPVAHERLQAEIAERGLVLSEHAPGERADGGAFPRRNRIIAALAELVIVVEAGARSGALITALRALELDRKVAAVPGPIDSARSAGSNALLRDGAHVLVDVEDALALAGLTPAPRHPDPALGPEAMAIFDVLAANGGSLRLEELATRMNVPLERCLVAVTELELAGAVVCDFTGEVTRRI